MPGISEQPAYDLVVVGGGMAAGRLLQQLHELNYTKTVAVLSQEPCAGYNRVLLPGFLSGRYQAGQLTTSEGWRTRDNFSVLANCIAERVDLATRSVVLSTGQTLGFTELVFATGSTVPRPQLPGVDLENIFELRSMNDADNIRRLVAQAHNAVVIGGGLLGLEAADALNDLGLNVCVVHRGKQLMNRQLDAAAGEQLAQAFAEDGISVKLDARVVSLSGREKVEAVCLDDGSRLPADILLLATGTTPNHQLARSADVQCEYGIVTDMQMRTSAPGVYALGECAQVAGNCHSLVEATHAQADALAKTLSGKPSTLSLAAPSTRLKVSNLEVFAAGQTRPAPQDPVDDIVVRDRSAGVYRRLLFSGANLLGAVLLGDTNAAREISQRIGSAVEGTERDRLVFGAG